jgi:hypothetical protein
LYLVGWGEIGERTRAGKEKSESKPWMSGVGMVVDGGLNGSISTQGGHAYRQNEKLHHSSVQ